MFLALKLIRKYMMLQSSPWTDWMTLASSKYSDQGPMMTFWTHKKMASPKHDTVLSCISTLLQLFTTSNLAAVFYLATPYPPLLMHSSQHPCRNIHSIDPHQLDVNLAVKGERNQWEVHHLGTISVEGREVTLSWSRSKRITSEDKSCLVEPMLWIPKWTSWIQK